MLRFTSLSKRIRSSLLVLSFAPLGVTCGCVDANIKTFDGYDVYAVLPAQDTDKADQKWATYMAEHLSRRASTAGMVAKPDEIAEGNVLNLYLDVDPNAEKDYAIETSSNAITLKVRQQQFAVWIIYQFISAASVDDARITAPDLPAPMFSFKEDAAGNVPFEYRGIYSPANTSEDLMPIMASHNVDFDWGLWGHNLHKVFPDGVPEEAKALVDGHRVDNQYCFSSEVLFNAVKEYVIDNYGYGSDDDQTRFAIMPNDNAQVCQCSKCVQAGNTSTSATPAVTHLLERLAAAFPKQLFFTSAYTSTRIPPSHRLPANTGVLVSTLDVPLTPEFTATPEGKTADENLRQWTKICSRVYVWDYMNNFDDYFTPYPCLHLLQARLQHYRDLGVRGVFFNGSGYDYETFDEVKTQTLAALMVNPDLDVSSYINTTLHRLYPQTGDLLGEFYEGIEQKALQCSRTHGLSPYAGIDDAINGYLSVSDFNSFVDRLDKASKQTTDEERRRLNRFLTAARFTQLEMMRSPSGKYNKARAAELCATLEGASAFDDMKNYREALGTVRDYLNFWRTFDPRVKTEGNLLADCPLTVSSPLDEGSKGAELLTDGLCGIASDYHTEWFINSSPNLDIVIPGDKVPHSGTVTAGILAAPVWHIFYPAAVQVLQGTKVLATQTVYPFDGTEYSERKDVAVNFSDAQAGTPITVRFVRADGKRVTTAVDEIVLVGR